jgi:hypothetical protein
VLSNPVPAAIRQRAAGAERRAHYDWEHQSAWQGGGDAESMWCGSSRASLPPASRRQLAGFGVGCWADDRMPVARKWERPGAIGVATLARRPRPPGRKTAAGDHAPVVEGAVSDKPGTDHHDDRLPWAGRRGQPKPLVAAPAPTCTSTRSGGPTLRRPVAALRPRLPVGPWLQPGRRAGPCSLTSATSVYLR